MARLRHRAISNGHLRPLKTFYPRMGQHDQCEFETLVAVAIAMVVVGPLEVRFGSVDMVGNFASWMQCHCLFLATKLFLWPGHSFLPFLDGLDGVVQVPWLALSLAQQLGTPIIDNHLVVIVPPFFAGRVSTHPLQHSPIHIIFYLGQDWIRLMSRGVIGLACRVSINSTSSAGSDWLRGDSGRGRRLRESTFPCSSPGL